MTALLETRGLVKRFGGIVPTNQVSLSLEAGARHALIGPNGAGKTTLINLLTGVLAPTAGTIWLAGDEITRLAPPERVRRGIVRTFQINQLFDDLTPLQSLALAASSQLGIGARWWQPLGRDPRVAPVCDRLLAQFRLDDVMHQPVKHLAYGKRRLLEIATALACAPRVLLLDEPVAGVPEGEREEIFDIVGALPAEVSVLLIEHDMDLVFNFATRVTVLVNGAVFAEGDVQAVANDPRVKAVYLGEGEGGGVDDGAATGAHG
jgi:branched-chain amino acid transport system ATP-binding protein